MNKTSKCNIMCDDGQKLTVYNSLTGKISRFSENARREVLEAFKVPTDNIMCNDFLLKQGFLIDNSVDEDEIITKSVDKLIKNEEMLFLTIYPTEACNFRCKYCPENTVPLYMDIKTSEKLLQFLDKVLYQFKRLVIAWFGGEPLLGDHIINSLSSEIKKLCRKHNVIFSATMTTNGYFLNAAMIRKMLENNVFSYCISLDGMPEIHDQQRQLKNGNPTWKKIIENLIQIRDTVASRMFTIIIRTNVTSSICNCSNKFFKLLSEEFGADRRFLFMWKKAEDWGNIEEADKGLICSYSDFLSFLNAAKQFGMHNNILSRSLNVFDRICETSIQNALVVFPDGRISKCSRDVQPEITTLGTIDELLLRPEYYLEKNLQLLYKNNCSKCSNYYRCLGEGCPLEDNECRLDLVYTQNVLLSISDADIPCGVIKSFGGI